MTQLRWTAFLLVFLGVMYWTTTQEQQRMQAVRAAKIAKAKKDAAEKEKADLAKAAKQDGKAADAAKGKSDKPDAKGGIGANPAVAAPPKTHPVEQVTLGVEGEAADYRMIVHTSSEGGVVRRIDLLPDKEGVLRERFTVLERNGAPNQNETLKLNLVGETLGDRTWEYVKAESKPPESVVYRTVAMDGKLEVTKRFSLTPGSYTMGLEVEFRNLGGETLDNVVYELEGPQNLPLEGGWYTQYYRRTFALLAPVDRASYLDEQYSNAIGTKGTGTPLSATPVRYAGISGQYFAAALVQTPAPAEQRYFQTVTPVRKPRLDSDPKYPDANYANLGVQFTSMPIKLAANAKVAHKVALFAGPKTHEVLDRAEFKEYELGKVMSYMGFMGMRFDSLSDFMVWLLKKIAGVVGDYGLAIIVMTMLVRLVLFPLSFKQTLTMQRMSEKMQILQPKMQEIREKYGKDAQKMNQELMELYRKHDYNPASMFGGCFLIFLQMPIFVALYQALQGSFDLRDRPFAFTWIRDLAAPDQLFSFGGVDVWFLGPYFNLLPLISIVQMLLQMWLMSPPPTSPEMEEQQKIQRRMMAVMMVWMGFLFYKVPSGLCLYIITSTTWALLERQFLPKPKTAPPPSAASAETVTPSTSPNGSAAKGESSWKKPLDKKKKR